MVEALRAIAVDIQPGKESLFVAAAVEDRLHVIVDRQRMKEIVSANVEPVQVDRKFVRKTVVCELVRVLVRVTEQLLQ